MIRLRDYQNWTVGKYQEDLKAEGPRIWRNVIFSPRKKVASPIVAPVTKTQIIVRKIPWGANAKKIKNSLDAEEPPKKSNGEYLANTEIGSEQPTATAHLEAPPNRK